tara:strand:+ start:376 stop:564 length:189 start_codon:yes stop_codon:yes gene_type:complete
MFENCIIKYVKRNNVNVCIRVTYSSNSDGSHKELSVPLDEANTDYQAILAWVADGNTIEEAD